MNRRLTLELGIRITHFPPWADSLGFGFSVFDYSKYNSELHADAVLRLPVEQARSVGAAGRLPDARAVSTSRASAWRTLCGNGKTVLRGGWGRYYYHSGQFTTGLNVSAGMQTVTLSNNQGTGGNTRCWRANSTR